jgi:hypothetical protein
MHYEIKFISEFNYVEVISFGEFTINNYEQQIKEAAHFGNENNTLLFLVDNSKLVNMASITDIYKVPGYYRDYIPEHGLKIAAIFSNTSKNKEAISFYENICFNQGINVKTFFIKDEAVKWLLS